MKRLKRHGKWFARDILHTNPEARKRLMEPGRNGRAVNARYLYFAVLYHIVLESKGQKVVARYCNTSSPTVHNGLKKVHVALANEGDAALQHRAHRLCKRLRIEPEKLQLFVQKINERPRPT
jgi:hypothetical protein